MNPDISVLTIFMIVNHSHSTFLLFCPSHTEVDYDKLFILSPGLSGVDTEVSAMEGDTVTLNTDIIKTQQDRMKWYFKGARIAEINGDQSKICEDDACPEIFRDRLKLDHQTGSLTITNTRNTHSGLYELQITSRRSEKKFNVTVHGEYHLKVQCVDFSDV